MNKMNRLRILRYERDIDQTTIANMLSISQSAYSNWETGKFAIDPDNLFKLAQFFNVSIDYLLGYSDKRESYNTEPADLLKDYLMKRFGKTFSECDLETIDDFFRLISEAGKS